ncbi:MAG: Unknown protein [uncultured Sulfurovum sp.]|uniref:Uncharacterized protein n=1 Tax=uncultured Sulfurovum sp. TaxID=269237 RepID=A0A6S6SWU7_9BACT|nr:MAG: Unknown protein [uncultured Sulfurovum sp.]
MLNNKFFRLGAVTALLTTTLLGAPTQQCVGGVCFANLDNLKPSKGFEEKKENLVILEQPRYVQQININAQNDFIDKSMTIVLDGELITVFPHSSYIMEESTLLVTESDDKIEDIILNKTELPSSDFFCEKNTKALYDSEKHTFQCV